MASDFTDAVGFEDAECRKGRGIVPRMVEKADAGECGPAFLQRNPDEFAKAGFIERRVRAESDHEIQAGGTALLGENFHQHPEKLRQGKRTGMVRDEHQHARAHGNASQAPVDEVVDGLRGEQ